MPWSRGGRTASSGRSRSTRGRAIARGFRSPMRHEEAYQPPERAGVEALFPDLLDAAEPHQGVAARGAGAHATPHVVGRVQFHVRFELLRERAVVLRVIHR